MASITLEKWVDELQSHGKYTFVRSDAIAETGHSQEAVKKALQRLARRGRIVKLKDYFFVIVPLEYASAGAPPPSWFVHYLMAAMKLPYYVGLLSAAALHGASHQQPQEFQVVTDRSVRDVSAGRTRIRFFASKFVAKASAMEVKTPTGAMRVSTPETTAVDLVRFARAAGHLDHVATVLAELSSTLESKKLLAAVRAVEDVPNAQRLGYILDHVNGQGLTNSVQAWVERQTPRLVPLRSDRSATGAVEDRRWHVLVNQPLEVEA
jgi:predicted transcriptional regulator of viral defense system